MQVPNMFNQVKVFSLWLISIVFWGSFFVIALNFFAPPWASKLDLFVDEHLTKWDEKTCISDPYGCLQNKQRKIEVTEQQLLLVIASLRESYNKVSHHTSSYEDLIIANERLIKEGEKLLVKPINSSVVSIWFAGQNYKSLEIFSQQVELLKKERLSLSTQQSQAVKIETKLKDKLDELLIKRGEISLQKQTVPSQLALLKANLFLNDFDGILTKIDTLLESSELDINSSSNLVLTTRDLLKRSDVFRESSVN